ncbi:MAG: glycine zipper 2TM domain-containing protein [Spongiibacter sp.]|uniref:glycine zipper 2TM domain-containing protein n=1 Tax=Spongiibacter TaxID=630749 RepID=UPI001AFEA965|nr:MULTISPECIES: glycine zipper 2TM domain-containing protein [Spongiibacter]MBO6752594.1 glycine zipper 2TM domain-containing protein [Spongiibacter sp.]|tara:strand:- start:24931 stop:25467 length:537 start_codon:yes stop_codon:yes gene_type:complete
MANPLLIAAGIGTVAVATAAGIGVYEKQSQPQFAQVLDVKPITETYFVSREECRDEVIQETAPSRDSNQVTGTVVGAVLGAVIGNQVGGGNGKKLATVAGAAAGGYAGKRVQEDMQSKNVQTRTERRCQTLEDPKQRVTGYQVSYSLNNETGTVVMSEPPGEQIPVVNGSLQLAVENQ